MSAVLHVEDLATHFFTRNGVVKAVDGVSFTLNKGEVLGLVGESGSGKSITGFSLIGLIDEPGRIVGGKVLLNGENLVGMPIDALRRLRGARIAMVFQDPSMALNPVLTIGRQMELALRASESVSADEAAQRSVAALEKVGIPDARRRLNAYPHEFSGGMRQRVAIAIALLRKPEVIICDEPTTALDVSIQAQILAEMKALVRDAGVALIWISHDLATVSAMADHLAVMYAGKLVESGETRNVLRAPYHPYTEGLLASLPSQAAKGAELRQIPGSTPQLLDLPPGCPFAPSCSYGDDLCRREEPTLSRDGGRSWRCFHPLGAAP